jgi:hypothetical protein
MTAGGQETLEQTGGLEDQEPSAKHQRLSTTPESLSDLTIP